MSEKTNIKRSNIPNNAFDIEYRTEWREEVDFLASRGIYYTIRKLEGEYNIPVYKYTKTADLFIALADFYMRRRRNIKSKATFKGFKKAPYEKRTVQQLSFLTKDGNLDEQYIADVEGSDTDGDALNILEKLDEDKPVSSANAEPEQAAVQITGNTTDEDDTE